jgi:hypothetical protein
MNFEGFTVFVAFVSGTVIRAQIYCHRTGLSYRIDLLTITVLVHLTFSHFIGGRVRFGRGTG